MSTWIDQVENVGGGAIYFFKIDDNFFLKIDNTYKLIISDTNLVTWTDQVEN